MPRAWTLFREYGLALFFNEATLAMGLLVFGLSGFVIASLSIVLSLAPLSPSPGVVVAVIYGAGTLTIITTIEVVIWAFKAICICFSQVAHATRTTTEVARFGQNHFGLTGLLNPIRSIV